MSAPANTFGGPVEQLLARLEGVRQAAPEQWQARCPAHEDKSPSLAIRAVNDRVLIHCFAGCDAGAVMDAVGLSLADLFDRPMERGSIPKRDRWSERGLLAQVLTEVEVVLIAANQVAKDKPLSAVDHKRLCDAHKRILSAWELVA